MSELPPLSSTEFLSNPTQQHVTRVSKFHLHCMHFFPLKPQDSSISPFLNPSNPPPSDPPIAAMSSAARPALKSRLRAGDALYGIFLGSFSPALAEIAGHAGYDFVVIDMEHGFGGISEALSCLHALSSSQTPAILRLPETSAVWAKKALDLGPMGLMFPMVHTPDLAQQAVSFTKYPRAGIRGVAHPVVRGSKYGLDENYLDWVEDELLIMCQVESLEAAEKIHEIAAVDGLDCVMIGPCDLGANLGYIRDPENESAVKMVRAVEEAVLARRPSGPYLAGLAMPSDGPNEMVKRGYNMICGAVDIALFRDAAVADVNKYRNAGKK